MWFLIILALSLSFSCLFVTSRADVPTIFLDQIQPLRTVPSSISLGPSAVFIDAPSPTGAGIPHDGIDIYLAQDIYDAVVLAGRANCQQIDQKCEKSLVNIIQSTKAHLEVRLVPLIPLVGGLVAAAFAMFFATDPSRSPPRYIHIPPSQLSQLSSAMASSSFVVSPTNGGTVITVTKTLTQPSGGPTVTPAPNSDIVIIMPESLAGRLDEIIRRFASPHCDTHNVLSDPGRNLPSRIRVPQAGDDVQAALCGAVGALANANGPLNDLLLLPDHAALIQFRAADVARALEAAIQFAAGLAALSDDVQHLIVNVAPMVFAIAYEVIVNHVQVGPTMTIPGSELQPSSTKPQPSSTFTSTGCPFPTRQAESPDCANSNCNGVNARHICQAEGKYKNCDCWRRMNPQSHYVIPSWHQFIFSDLDIPGDAGTDDTIGQDLNGGNGQQQIALASYINPLVAPETWERMINYLNGKVSVLVANVLNGPDTKPNDAWATVISKASDKGKTVIGYVRTGYLGVSKQHFKTMLGSTDLADWIAQIENDVELWYKLYPGKIGGIFFDEGWNQCGPNNIYADIYRLISENTKRKHPGAYTVLNPGDRMPQCFVDSADTLLTYESSYENYIDPSKGVYQDNGWISGDMRKIWHIVYNVPIEKVRDITLLARSRGAGLLHITNAIMPNPYNTLPNEAYMNTLISAVGSGKPNITAPRPWPPGIGSPPPPPNSLKVTDFDYTSVKLEWIELGDPEAIIIYRFDNEVARLPGSMTRVTIGNLPTAFKGHKFKVSAIGQDGTTSGFSNVVTVDTKPLPGGKPIINVKVSASPTETIYEADVLLPYAFIRILVTDTDIECNYPAYTANTDKNFVCAHYMIEGETSYRYAGTARASNGYWPWEWAPTAPLNNEGNNMDVKRNRYHYIWRLPIGTSTIDTTNFILQGEGFSPRTDVFVPCPCLWKAGDKVIEDLYSHELKYCQGQRDWCPYDCKGKTLCSSSSKKWCDKAVNQMTRGNKVYWSSDIIAEAGNCWANSAGYGCGVQVRGTKENGQICRMTGDEIWWAYQNITNADIGGCKQCGSKRSRDRCMVSIDYYEQCGNRDIDAINRYLDLETPPIEGHGNTDTGA